QLRLAFHRAALQFGRAAGESGRYRDCGDRHARRRADILLWRLGDGWRGWRELAIVYRDGDHVERRQQRAALGVEFSNRDSGISRVSRGHSGAALSYRV